MSLDASRWAWQQKVGRSSAKLVLLALADAANHFHECFPSIKRIGDDTELDRKTIINSLQELMALGLVEDTGERRGRTAQVKVFRLMGVPERHSNSGNGNAQKHSSSSQSQALKESPNRNSSQSGIVPSFPLNSTVCPTKEYRNWDTEPTREPISNSQDIVASESADAGRISKRVGRTVIPSNWKPQSETIELLISVPHSIPRQFIEELKGEFVVYWRDRSTSAASWDAKFIQRCSSEWKRNYHKWNQPSGGNIDANRKLSNREPFAEQVRNEAAELLQKIEADAGVIEHDLADGDFVVGTNG